MRFGVHVVCLAFGLFMIDLHNERGSVMDLHIGDGLLNGCLLDILPWSVGVPLIA